MAKGLFDDEDEQIAAFEQAKIKDQESPPTAAPLGKTGRPRSAQNREVFTIKPLTRIKDKIKLEALLHKCTSSDVVDALTEQFLDELDWDQVGRYS